MECEAFLYHAVARLIPVSRHVRFPRILSSLAIQQLDQHGHPSLLRHICKHVGSDFTVPTITRQTRLICPREKQAVCRNQHFPVRISDSIGRQ